MPEYIVLSPETKTPFTIFTTREEAEEHACFGGGGTTIWQKVGTVTTTVEWLDQSMLIYQSAEPEPRRRGRPRKAAMPHEPLATADEAREDVGTPALTVESVSVGEDGEDGPWRCVIVTNRGYGTGYGDSRQTAVMQAEINAGIMSDIDFNALPDTEGKRQLAEARG